MGRLTVVCSLFDSKPDKRKGPWSGWGIYTPEWVDKLYRGVERNLSTDFRMVCVTTYGGDEFVEDVEAVPFKQQDHVGEWVCLNEVFRSDLGIDRGVWMGLDTIIVSGIDDLASYAGTFALARDRTGGYEVCNPVALFHGPSCARIWDEYEADPVAVNARSTTKWSRGMPTELQHWRTGHGHEVIDDLYPDRLVEYASDYRRHGLTDRSSIVFFGGSSKPSRLPAGHPLLAHWR